MTQLFSTSDTGSQLGESFFPMGSINDRRLETRFRKSVRRLPPRARLSAYALLTSFHPHFARTRFIRSGEHIAAEQCGTLIYFPKPLPLIKHSHLAFGYEEWLRRKYALPGFVSVQPGDTVVDCGAYVGGFTLSAARVAGEVHLFEPSHTNFEAARLNLSAVQNVALNQVGLYSEDTTTYLNLSASSVEHSLITPDDGQVHSRQPVTLSRLDSYCSSNGIGQLDFLKVEAEGVEPEVIQGLGALRPTKCAIDVSPERDGLSPAAELTRALESQGYMTRQRGNVLFARLDMADAP